MRGVPISKMRSSHGIDTSQKLIRRGALKEIDMLSYDGGSSSVAPRGEGFRDRWLKNPRVSVLMSASEGGATLPYRLERWRIAPVHFAPVSG